MWSIEIGVLENVQKKLVGVIGLEGHPIPVQLFGELFRFELVPFAGRGPVPLVLCEAPLVELLELVLSLSNEDALIGVDDKGFSAGTLALVLDERLEIFVMFNIILPLQLIKHLVIILLAICLAESDFVHFTAQRL